jgi:hypothetical protein
LDFHGWALLKSFPPMTSTSTKQAATAPMGRHSPRDVAIPAQASTTPDVPNNLAMMAASLSDGARS